MVKRLLKGLALAVALTLAFEFAHGLHESWSLAFDRLLELPLGVVALGVLLIWSLLTLLDALTTRLWLSTGILGVVLAIVAAADVLKMRHRGEPLFVTDALYIGEIGFLIEAAGTGTVAAVVATIVGLPLLVWLLAVSPLGERLRRPKADERETSGGWPGRRTRLVAAVISLALVSTAFTFNATGNVARRTYEAANAHWATWDQAENYDENGLIAGLLYTLPASIMRESDAYSQQTMDDLVERYTSIAAELNADRAPGALDDANVVLVLSETLSDPLALDGISAEEDPLPFLRELMAENPSGTLLSSGFGGGTATVEFEVMTGMAASLFEPQVDTPYQSVVAGSQEFPSHLGTFGGEERESLAIHPFLSTFYRRSSVYEAFGFDEAAFRDDLTHLRNLPGDGYVSDRSLFADIVNRLEANDSPMLVNAVTMQNHGPHTGLAHPITVDGPLSDSQKSTAGQYLRGLAHSDEALRGLREDLESMDERTIVLLYGDHLPGFWPEDILDASGETARFETPWVVFANFPLEDIDAGTVGANQLVTKLLDAANAPHTPWTALLHEVASEVPAMERTAWLDTQESVVTEDELSETAQRLLADYRLAQYDMTVGNGWATDALLTPPG